MCNAIEVAQGRRDFAGFTRGTPLASDPDAPAVLGYATTAVIAALPLHSPTEDADVVRARRLEYFHHMAAAPQPSIAVVQVQDSDFPDCIGAWWGEVHLAPREKRIIRASRRVLQGDAARAPARSPAAASASPLRSVPRFAMLGAVTTASDAPADPADPARAGASTRPPLRRKAARAGIAKSTVYLYFDNKEASPKATVAAHARSAFEDAGTHVGAWEGNAATLLGAVLREACAGLVQSDNPALLMEGLRVR